MSLYTSGVVRIISDLRFKSFDTGKAVCNFSGGINDGKDSQGNYIKNAIDLEIWDKLGELVNDTCKKGDSIFVTGMLKRQEWDDKETGKPRSKHILSVSRFEYLPRAKAVDEEAAF